MTTPLVSFIATFMVCEGYEWIEDKTYIFINNIEHFCNILNISYEIILCEQISIHNKKIIGDSFRNIKNVKVIETDGNYPSPLGYKFLESYGKNACLNHVSGEFVCSTNTDVLFSEKFFKFISTELKHRTLYRFADYEFSETNEKDIEKLLMHCEDKKVRLCNPGCFNINPTFADVGQKSGDIILLDTNSFRHIRGYPINECYDHVDTSTCIVAMNNFPLIVPSKDICIYTMVQSTGRQRINDSKKEAYEWNKCLSYLDKKFSNPPYTVPPNSPIKRKHPLLRF